MDPVSLPSVDIESMFYMIYRGLLHFGALFNGSGTILPDTNAASFQDFYLYVEIFLFILGVVAASSLAYFIVKKREILEKGDSMFKEKYESKTVLKEKNVLWESIRTHLATESPSAWKLAVIEADKLLDDLTVKQGFFGDTLGERLKNADESLFRTLQDAWEAHKIRNRIAHEAGYQLTRRDAQRAVGMYEHVFQEFKII